MNLEPILITIEELMTTLNPGNIKEQKISDISDRVKIYRPELTDECNPDIFVTF